MTDAANRHWKNVYQTLSEGLPRIARRHHRPGRGADYRLALVYALLEQTAPIDAVHLDAAFALWNFCVASARYILAISSATRSRTPSCAPCAPQALMG